MNLICGINPVVEALRAGSRHFDRLLIVKGLRNRRVSEAIARASQSGVPLRFEPREALDRMAGGTPHQGIIAVVSEKSVLALPDLLAVARDPALFLVLDGVLDPRNLGAILRTAEAAGADGVVIPERHTAGLSETVARSSAGALEHVRLARVGNLVNAIEDLKARGIWVVGFDAQGKERWDAVDLKRPTALVLGGEGKGIRRLVREHCDHVASLPLFGHVESLNVSVVAGIALYEAVRQRRAMPSHVRPIPQKTKSASRQIVGPTLDDREYDPGATLGALPGNHEAVDVEIEDDVAWDVIRVHGLDEGGDTARGFRGPQRSGRRPEGPHGRDDRRRRRRRGRGSQPPPPGGDSRPPQAQSGAGRGGEAPGGRAPGPPQGGGRRRRRRRER